MGGRTRERQASIITGCHLMPRIRAALSSGWLCMTAASSRFEPVRPKWNPTGSPVAPQYHELFLQPEYTVDLPLLDDDEGDFLPQAPLAPAQQRCRTARVR